MKVSGQGGDLAFRGSDQWEERIVHDKMLGDKYDAVVVGGGPAGLGAGLVLARARRSVLVIDSAESSPGLVEHSHDHLERVRVNRADLVAAGRMAVRDHGGEVAVGTVASVEAIDQPESSFRVRLANGHTVQSRRVLIATGAVIALPDVPGLEERWGRDVLQCPHCQGWELRDQAVGVLATGPTAVAVALTFRQWTADVTLFLHTGPEPGELGWQQLAARGISVVDGEVTGLEVNGEDHLTGVRLHSGKVINRQALVVTPEVRARTEILSDLGAKPLDQDGDIPGAQIPGATSVPGVWVTGSSAAAGDVAAAISADLITEDLRLALATHRRRDPFSAEVEQQVSDLVLGDRRHGLSAKS